MNLSSKTLLFMSAEHLQAYVWDSGNLSEAQFFTNDLAGREQFSAYLKPHHNPTCLLVDLVEEDFRPETVPHLTGKVRREFIARKFEQYFRNTPFRQTIVLRRQTVGRRDDEVLFSALTNPQRILPWLDTLLSNNIPIIGINSLPHICTPLLKGITADHVLLLSWEKQAGLRQTYFNRQCLLFSRLTPLHSSDYFGEIIATETPRTRQYLKSLSLPLPGEVLDVYIVCHANEKTRIESRLQSTPDLHYSYLDIQALGNKFKANAVYPDSDATQLFLHLLATKAPTNQYANSTHTHYYLLWQLRRLFSGFAVVAAFVSIIWSLDSIWQGRDYVSETGSLITQTAQLTHQALAITAKLPATAMPAADMKTAVALVHELSKFSPLPEKILSPLSSVLNQFIRIRLNNLSWQTSFADAAPSAYPAQVITLNGSLLDFGNDYRNALVYLENFQLALRQLGYEVTAQTLPLDISPKGSINGDLQLKQEKEDQFTLKLIWREK